MKPFLGVVLAAALLTSRDNADAARASCDDARSNPQLSEVSIQTGRLAPGESACFCMSLARGELVRIAISAERGYLRARILSPRHEELQRTWTSSFAFAAPSPMLTLEAPAAGKYFVELRVPTWAGFTDPQSFGIHVESRESAATREARRAQLLRDPRVAWLRSNAKPLRTLSSRDDDFADLDFLRDVLRDSRLVFLGEGDNGGGSDIVAKARLVRFLHSRMGFDVLAFQANIYSAAAAWEALQADTDPRAAFDLAVSRLLSRSAQGRPLIDYVGAASRSSRPLELAGFDTQFTGVAAQTLMRELRGVLVRKAPTSILLDTTALSTRTLAAAVAGRLTGERSNLSGSAQDAVIAVLNAEAQRLASLADDREAQFWGQVLRSAGSHIQLLLNDALGASANETMATLVRQLGENLLWLANSRYPDRKIIVWAHTFHGARSPAAFSHGRAVDHTVGEAVWRALGPQSFSIGLTSYDGASRFITQPDEYFQSVIANQALSESFESLMAAAGHEIAFVNLRTAREQHAWPGGRFTSNALYLVPEEAEWSRVLDALLFIRTQEPRLRAEPY